MAKLLAFDREKSSDSWKGMASFWTALREVILSFFTRFRSAVLLYRSTIVTCPRNSTRFGKGSRIHP